jgi:hypothetical protein
MNCHRALGARHFQRVSRSMERGRGQVPAHSQIRNFRAKLESIVFLSTLWFDFRTVFFFVNCFWYSIVFTLLF